jgi:hypothetical protein
MALDNNPKTKEGLKKTQYHLIPSTILRGMAEVLKLGASKYGAYNWRKNSVSISTYHSAIMRHLIEIQEGRDIDPESGQSHWSHIASCAGIVEDCRVQGNLIDDRPLTQLMES